MFLGDMHQVPGFVMSLRSNEPGNWFAWTSRANPIDASTIPIKKNRIWRNAIVLMIKTWITIHSTIPPPSTPAIYPCHLNLLANNTAPTMLPMPKSPKRTRPGMKKESKGDPSNIESGAPRGAIGSTMQAYPPPKAPTPITTCNTNRSNFTYFMILFPPVSKVTMDGEIESTSPRILYSMSGNCITRTC